MNVQQSYAVGCANITVALAHLRFNLRSEPRGDTSNCAMLVNTDVHTIMDETVCSTKRSTVLGKVCARLSTRMLRGWILE
jgi:hypothetical protein